MIMSQRKRKMANEPEGVAVTNQFGDDDDGHHRHLSQTKSEKRGKEGSKKKKPSTQMFAISTNWKQLEKKNSPIKNAGEQPR